MIFEDLMDLMTKSQTKSCPCPQVPKPQRKQIRLRMEMYNSDIRNTGILDLKPLERSKGQLAY